jgi:hypothetical protein|tara:strand:+ start:235 stop:387 length:153 start_codon:yes stop_codon:yes gene_type:complete
MKGAIKIDMWAKYPKLMQKHLDLWEKATVICENNGRDLADIVKKALEAKK